MTNIAIKPKHEKCLTFKSPLDYNGKRDELCFRLFTCDVKTPTKVTALWVRPPNVRRHRISVWADGCRLRVSSRLKWKSILNIDISNKSFIWIEFIALWKPLIGKRHSFWDQFFEIFDNSSLETNIAIINYLSLHFAHLSSYITIKQCNKSHCESRSTKSFSSQQWIRFGFWCPMRVRLTFIALLTNDDRSHSPDQPWPALVITGQTCRNIISRVTVG